MEVLNKAVAARSEEVPGRSKGSCMHVVSAGYVTQWVLVFYIFKYFIH